MLVAAVFVIVFGALLLRVIVSLARRGAGYRITGPKTKVVDHDNPTEQGTYFWTDMQPR